ncbi:MAG: DUF3631 domain-containing protein [Myxococcota bacterium]
MPRVCTICSHAEREAIDKALVTGEALRAIARQWRVSKDALRRHRNSDIPAALAKATEAQEVGRADDLLAQVRSLQTKALSILDQAEAAGEHRTALVAIREARATVELIAKLVGELDDRQTINILVAPQWLSLRTAIVTALEPHPAARAAVVAALEALRAADPAVPDAILSDRAQDNARPLLAISDACGGAWPARLRAALTTLARDAADESTTGRRRTTRTAGGNGRTSLG